MTTTEAEVLWTPKMKGRKGNYLENNETQLNNRSAQQDVRMEWKTGMQDLVCDRRQTNKCCGSMLQWYRLFDLAVGTE